MKKGWLSYCWQNWSNWYLVIHRSSTGPPPVLDLWNAFDSRCPHVPSDVALRWRLMARGGVWCAAEQLEKCKEVRWVRAELGWWRPRKMKGVVTSQTNKIKQNLHVSNARWCGLVEHLVQLKWSLLLIIPLHTMTQYMFMGSRIPFSVDLFTPSVTRCTLNTD